MKRHHALMGLMLTTAACAGAEAPPLPPPIQQAVEVLDERAGVPLADEGFGDGATKLVYLDQGWSPPETLWYYFADQGSALMPYEVLVHLEQADSDKPVLAPENLAKWRWLVQRATPNNPDALPVGMSRHGDSVGLTCAACHTTEINYHGTAMRIDGGPSLMDFIGWGRSIEDALSATLSDPQKLARFAARYKGGAEAARAALTQSLDWFKGYYAANKSSVTEGYTRLDAVGRIVNQVVRFTSDVKNSVPPTAPVSYPCLWDAPRHDYVQWTAFSPNAGDGALGRNAGEVIGVFGQVTVKHYETQDEAKKGYPSSIQGADIVHMEDNLRKLESPLWPESILPPIDRALAARGKTLYEAQCQSCHAPINRTAPNRMVTAIVTGVDVVGTDAQTAKNIVTAQLPTGILQGAISPMNTKYGASAPALALLGDLATRVLQAEPIPAAAALAESKLRGTDTTTAKQGNHPQDTTQNPLASIMSYKARPLNGVWATAPYLHNGSVPTLYDLLLPPASRPKKFAVGRREYDPKKVGFVSDGAVPFVIDTTTLGNGNGGHTYGTTLSDPDRWALVEYLKTL